MKLSTMERSATLVMLFGLFAVTLFALLRLLLNAIPEGEWAAVALIGLGGMFAVGVYAKARAVAKTGRLGD